MPSQYVNLMPEDQDLGCQRRSRSEQPDQHRTDKAAGFLHRTERLRDSASVVSPIEFTTGTTGGLHCPDLTQRRQALFSFGGAVRLVAYFPNGEWPNSASCACRKSNSHIQMIKSAQKCRRQNAT